MIPFIKKYAPSSLREIKGQDKAIREIIALLKRWKPGDKAILIYGPSGCGKTILAGVIASYFNYELYEINASDVRDGEQIHQKLGGAALQRSLFFKGKLILVDEIDGLAGKEDRGGMGAVIEIIGKSRFPLILTASNPWDFKFNSLRKRCSLIELNALSYTDIEEILKNICTREKIDYEPNTLKSLCRRAGGDCRAAINDLQSLSEPAKRLTKESLDELEQRIQEESIPAALLKIFKTTEPKIAIGAFDNVREDLEQQMLWIDHNLPFEYDKAEDLARAYDKLSKADVFNRRIKRWQQWRFLVYINALITGGIAVSKDEKYHKFVQYKPTGRLLKLWWAKQKGMKKKAIAAKIAEKSHSSVKEVMKDIEYFKVIFRKNREMAKSIAEYADLDNEEVEWMKK